MMDPRVACPTPFSATDTIECVNSILLPRSSAPLADCQRDGMLNEFDHATFSFEKRLW
jgi:hypothetical protein